MFWVYLFDYNLFNVVLWLTFVCMHVCRLSVDSMFRVLYPPIIWLQPRREHHRTPENNAEDTLKRKCPVCDALTLDAMRLSLVWRPINFSQQTGLRLCSNEQANQVIKSVYLLVLSKLGYGQCYLTDTTRLATRRHVASVETGDTAAVCLSTEATKD